MVMVVMVPLLALLMAMTMAALMTMIMAVLMTMIMTAGDGPADLGLVGEAAGAVQDLILLIQATHKTTIAVGDDMAAVVDGLVLGHRVFVLARALPKGVELVHTVLPIVTILPRVVAIPPHVLVILPHVPVILQNVTAACPYHTVPPHVLVILPHVPVILQNVTAACRYHTVHLQRMTPEFILPVHLADLLTRARLAHAAQIIHPADPLTPIHLAHAAHIHTAAGVLLRHPQLFKFQDMSAANLAL